MKKIIVGAALSVAFSAAAQTNFVYHGGPIVGPSIRILPIFWGPTENSSIITAFYQEMSTRLGLYNFEYRTASTTIGSGTAFATGITITPSFGTATTVQWADIQNELSLLISQGVVPPQNPGLIYAFHFPSSVTVVLWNGLQMCQSGIGGVHGSFSPWPGPGSAFPWITVVPTCNTNLDATTPLAYHELWEQITNPETGGAPGYVNAWVDNTTGDEIVDLCQNQFGLLKGDYVPPAGATQPAHPGSFVIERIWSNAAHGCVTDEPQLDDATGVHVPAGHSVTVPFMAGEACLPTTSVCSVTGSDPTGQVTAAVAVTNSPADHGTATLTASLSAATGSHTLNFHAQNSSTGQSANGISLITVDPCAPGTLTNPANCGASCGLVCSAPANGSPTCSNGVCGSVCNAGFAMCSAGACTALNTNQNCGACGNPCTGSATCQGGQCIVTCGAGQANCGGVCTTLGTNNNCAACGNACASGDVCSAGSCTTPPPACPPNTHSCGDGTCVRNGAFCP